MGVKAYIAIVLRIILVWLGWKVTEVTIMQSWLNRLGLVMIYIGVALTHSPSLIKIYKKIIGEA